MTYSDGILLLTVNLNPSNLSSGKVHGPTKYIRSNFGNTVYTRKVADE